MALFFRSRYFSAQYWNARYWHGATSSTITVPTFTVADNGDGTGGVVTIANSNASATNRFYAASTVSGSPWVDLGARTGDGTLAISLATGTYHGYVYSTLGSEAAQSLVGSFTISANDVTPISGHFWIDCKTTMNQDGEAVVDVSFWPASYQTAHEPTALCSLRDRPGDHSNVILGCSDGYLRRHQRNLSQDDGTNFSSYVDLGPIPLGGDGGDGTVAEISGTTAANSGDVDWAVRVGTSAEAAFNASTFDSGSWNDTGLSYVAQPRARGQAFCVRLTNGENNAEWSIENVIVVLESGGKLRR